jgi:hypothetical protein
VERNVEITTHAYIIHHTQRAHATLEVRRRPAPWQARPRPATPGWLPVLSAHTNLHYGTCSKGTFERAHRMASVANQCHATLLRTARRVGQCVGARPCMRVGAGWLFVKRAQKWVAVIHRRACQNTGFGDALFNRPSVEAPVMRAGSVSSTSAGKGACQLKWTRVYLHSDTTLKHCQELLEHVKARHRPL